MLARIRKSMEEKDQGFTLIELLVVMIIIGILAAIAIPVFLNQRKKAVDSGIKSDLRNVATEVETSFVDNQSYPNQTGWTTVNATLLPGLSKLTTGDTLEYRNGAASGTYCIRGYNAAGTANGTTASHKYFFVDSSNGGLQPAAADTTTNCPAT